MGCGVRNCHEGIDLGMKGKLVGGMTFMGISSECAKMPVAILLRQPFGRDVKRYG